MAFDLEEPGLPSQDELNTAFGVEQSEPAPETTPQAEPEDPSTQEPAPESQPYNPDWEAEVEVPNVGRVRLGELRDGYLRQSDYTRKTQEVAQQREELQLANQFLEGLRDNPEYAIRALADAYGVSISEATDMAQSMVDQASDQQQQQALQLPPEVQQKLDAVDQIQRELAERREQEMVREAQTQIDQELNDLQQRYGEFDQAELIEFALSRNTPDLELAFLALRSDKEFKRGLEKGRKESVERTEASMETPSATSPGVGSIDSFEDAWEAAERVHT